MTDDFYFNILGFHLHQSAEYALRYLSEIDGQDYVKTHNIRNLINNISNNQTDRLRHLNDKAYILSSWEKDTRYVLDFNLTLNEINEMLSIV